MAIRNDPLVTSPSTSPDASPNCRERDCARASGDGDLSLAAINTTTTTVVELGSSLYVDDAKGNAFSSSKNTAVFPNLKPGHFVLSLESESSGCDNDHDDCPDHKLIMTEISESQSELQPQSEAESAEAPTTPMTPLKRLKVFSDLGGGGGGALETPKWKRPYPCPKTSHRFPCTDSQTTIISEESCSPISTPSAVSPVIQKSPFAFAAKDCLSPHWEYMSSESESESKRQRRCRENAAIDAKFRIPPEKLQGWPEVFWHCMKTPSPLKQKTQ